MTFHQAPQIFVGEVQLIVENLKRSMIFYRDTLGFQVLRQTEKTAVLSADGKRPLITIEQPEGVLQKEPRKTGLYHVALLLPNRSDLGRMLAHLINIQYPLGASDHLVSEALYLDDPDGNGLEIYADRPSRTWTWQNNEISMVTNPLDAESLLAEANGEEWNRMPSGTIIGHIHLHVANIKQAETFYLEGLGFDLAARYGDQAAFISTGGYHHHIAFNTWNGTGIPAPKKNSVGLKWYSLILPNNDVKNKIVEQLDRIGSIVNEENELNFTQDPSGTNIVLQVLKN
ncbi:VOC family protein [Metabacillus arenae]|uniref:VOC family protein n=1 Tax=Metabacillus arenae TaxID=2771434 RepID=A0A926NGE9_9BACI|nr:VOC family protein [Metabacillus arenae]MBD1381084.1 VOC family protein [Metabacillus arenae]